MSRFLDTPDRAPLYSALKFKQLLSARQASETTSFDLNMRKLFVTGGAGFIGSAFIRLLLAERPDCHIVNYDALTYAGNPDNLIGLDAERHRFVRGDISNRDEVLAALDDETDAIINFA